MSHIIGVAEVDRIDKLLRCIALQPQQLVNACSTALRHLHAVAAP